MNDEDLKIIIDRSKKLEEAIKILKNTLNLSIEVETETLDNGEINFVGIALHYGDNGNEWAYLKISEGNLLGEFL